MIKFLHPYAAVAACILTLTYLNYTSAHKKHNINEFLVENKRTRFTKQNYVMQRDRSNSEGGLENAVQLYEGEGSRKEDDLPALIVDYANMIRNDILLMDNSVETRTRKRGEANGGKLNQAISDPPCSCEFSKIERDLGEESYPRYIETKVCDNTLCPVMYACKKNQFNITVLKRRSSLDERSEVEVPRDLQFNWSAHKEVITVGCSCLRLYVEPN